MKINSENLKAIRIKKGIGQVELAEKAESTQSMISQLENGCRGCHPQLAEKIASVLECGVEEITGEPSMWVQFMRNCKRLSFEQMQSINGVVIQMIKGSAQRHIA